MPRKENRQLASPQAAVSRRSPKGWPDDVVYIDSPRSSSGVTAESCSQINRPPSGTSVVREAQKGPSPLVRIVTIQEKSHPACGQRGLFASQHLTPDTFILNYIGYVHGKDDADPTSDYDLSFDRELGIGIDASTMGNEARFINDYRGTPSSGPNAEFREMWVDVGNGRFEKRIGVFVLSAGKAGKRSKGIRKGQEILVTYGKGFWSERSKEPSVAEEGEDPR